MVAAALLVYGFLVVGEVSWSTGEPFTKQEAVGFPLYISMSLFFVLPLLGSAVRMPEAYGEHFHPRLSRNRVA